MTTIHITDLTMLLPDRIDKIVETDAVIYSQMPAMKNSQTTVD